MLELVRTYRTALKMTPAAHKRLDQVLRAQCWLYNQALEERINAYKERSETVTFKQQSKALTALRAERPDWAAINRTIQVATLRRLDNAYKAFFRRVKEGKEKAGFPKFKGSKYWNTLICDNNVAARHMVKCNGQKGKVRIKGLPVMGFRVKRGSPPLDQLAGFKVCRTPRRVELQLTYTSEVEAAPISELAQPIGIDVGVVSKVALSDGTLVQPLEQDVTREKELQQRASKSKRGSKKRQQRFGLLRKERDRNRQARKGFDHELSARIVKDYDFIAVEDLETRYMTKSAKGTVEKPGKNVAQKTGLNRSILAQTWAGLFQKLEYKSEAQGIQFVRVDPRSTSRLCSQCGAKRKIRYNQRTYTCRQCGLVLDRDINAARNILERGLATLPAGS